MRDRSWASARSSPMATKSSTDRYRKSSTDSISSRRKSGRCLDKPAAARTELMSVGAGRRVSWSDAASARARSSSCCTGCWEASRADKARTARNSASSSIAGGAGGRSRALKANAARNSASSSTGGGWAADAASAARKSASSSSSSAGRSHVVKPRPACS